MRERQRENLPDRAGNSTSAMEIQRQQEKNSGRDQMRVEPQERRAGASGSLTAALFHVWMLNPTFYFI